MAEITWIKLKTDMFNSTKIRLIEKLPEGDTILVIWIKLLTAAGKANSNGYIMLSENIPMNVEEMAVVFDRPLNTVRLALEAFKRYGMIEVDENEIVRIANWEKHQNIDGMEKVRLQNAKRNREYRERKKQQALQAPKPSQNKVSDVSVTSRDGTEEEKEIDIDKEIDKEREEDKNPLPPSPLIDHEFLKVKNHFETHVIYQPAAYVQVKAISDWMDDGYQPDLIIKAMGIAVERGKPAIPYINGILKTWKADGIVNIQQLLAKEAQANGIHSGHHARHNGPSTSPVPSIITKRSSLE